MSVFLTNVFEKYGKLLKSESVDALDTHIIKRVDLEVTSSGITVWLKLHTDEIVFDHEYLVSELVTRFPECIPKKRTVYIINRAKKKNENI